MLSVKEYQAITQKIYKGIPAIHAVYCIAQKTMTTQISLCAYLVAAYIHIAIARAITPLFDKRSKIIQ